MGVAVEGSASVWPGPEAAPTLPRFEASTDSGAISTYSTAASTPFAYTASPAAPWILAQRNTRYHRQGKAPLGPNRLEQGAQGETDGIVTIARDGEKASPSNLPLPSAFVNPRLAGRVCGRRGVCFHRGGALYKKRSGRSGTMGKGGSIRKDVVGDVDSAHDRDQRIAADEFSLHGVPDVPVRPCKKPRCTSPSHRR